MIANDALIHFIGIGGAGMSGIAQILLELKVPVSGSDLKENENTQRLAALGATIFIGHGAENLLPEAAAVVFSSAVSPDNPEMAAARARGIKVMARAEMLAELVQRQESIAVAGAHGKTTTTAMISLMLEVAGMDPTIVIGGYLKQINSNAKLGKGRYLVAEADESDGSFLKLLPKIAVITNIENDHLDYYGSLENIVAAFVKFVAQIPPDGFTVVCLDSRELAQISRTVPGSYITYSIGGQPADYTIRDLTFHHLQSRCQVIYRGETLGELELNVPGRHNIANALAAIAVGRQLGLTFQQAVGGLKLFTGAKRRFELIDQTAGITIVDDYAHHPTELQASLRGARDAGFQRIVAVFQPHRYSRTQLLLAEFGASFFDADVVIVNEIYAACEAPIPGVNGELIVDAIRKNDHQDCLFCRTEDDIIACLLEIIQPGDLVITLGAGNIRQAGIRLAAALNGGGRKQ